MTTERENELKELAKNALIEFITDDFFDYGMWDGSIECDEELTYEELEWMRANIKFEIKVK